MNWVSSIHPILLRQNLTVPTDDITCVLLEQADEAQVKLAMTLDGVTVVLDRLNQLALLDVHGFHSEPAFLFLQLIVHHFLEAHALEAEHAAQAVVLSLV